VSFEDARRVKFGVGEPDRRQVRRFFIFHRRGFRGGDEVRFDRDQIVDQFGARDCVIKADRNAIIALEARHHADGCAGTGQSGHEVRTDGGIGGNHGFNDVHAHGFRMTEPQVRRARVISVGRNAAWVVREGEREPVLAALRKTQARAVLAPGDSVTIAELEDDRVVIDSIEERSFALIRRTAGGRTKTMAANVETMAIVVALADPPPSLTFIDMLICFAVQHGIEATLILTKADIAGLEAAATMAALYEPLEVPVLVVQPKSGEGIEALRHYLQGRHALLVGNSGVGKSSIFKALGGTATVGDLSRFGRGKQTTTSARLYQTEDGFLVDSPGIGEFILDPIPQAELTQLFREMREPATRCRFDDCRHLAEPDCAVREAVDEGRIAPSRYASYRELATAPGLHSGRDF
jgi:ribosome biogenesis GTPase / thiamine phosphate phosphatase